MVRNIPKRFKNVAFAFDALRLCESSGTEHSPAAESLTDLSDLVWSFVEGEGKIIMEETEERTALVDDENDIQDDDGKSGSFDFEATKESLKEIFGCNLGEGDEDRRKILAEVKAAFKSIGHHENNSHDFKHGWMAFLRKRGFDAGLCKSRWEKTARFPAGDYHYMDVNVNGVRYIVEASLAGQFEIARPTNQFNLLVELLPPIFVGLPDELKQVISPKDENSVLQAVKKIHSMIDKEIADGTSPNHVFVCGFSQGGALTLASVLLYPKTLGGVPLNSSFLEQVSANAKRTPILWSHGMADPTVLFEAGQAGPPLLSGAGMSCEFKAYPGLGHSINNEELKSLESWIRSRLQSSS